MAYVRAEPRRIIAARVQVEWKDSKGSPKATLAMLEDISPSGMGLSIAVKLETGWRVQISWKGTTFGGTVMHCRSAGYQFVMGIKKDVPRQGG